MLWGMAVGIELERLRRITGGRVHLAPHVPASGPVVTLCGQTFAEGTYQATDAEADCRNCLRRAGDAARVSSAFFQSDVGAELLQRSLEQARARREAAPQDPPTKKAPAPEKAPSPKKAPAPASTPLRPSASSPARGEGRVSIRGVRSGTPLRPTFENVYVSPEGVIIRASDGAVGHVAFNGPVDVRHRDGALTLRIGDVVLEFETREET
jgi:hypothetical protein